MILDLSKYNTVVDWSKVKESCDGVILRCGFRGYGSGKIVLDAKYNEYAYACTVHKIPFGVYFMSQAITEAEGIEEAAYCIAKGGEYGAVLPMCIDSEDGDGTHKVVRADGLSKAKRTAVVKAFLNTIRSAGYTAGIYANEDWFNHQLDYEQLKNDFVWVAKYGKNTGGVCTRVNLPKYDMHQFTSKRIIPGISGVCDASMPVTDLIKPVEQQPVQIVIPDAHIQPNYQPGHAYFVHAEGLAVRAGRSTDSKLLYRLSNTAVLNKATARDEKGWIWMNVSGKNVEEWACADNTARSYIY